jgi:hypothetical protein
MLQSKIISKLKNYYLEDREQETFEMEIEFFSLEKLTEKNLFLPSAFEIGRNDELYWKLIGLTENDNVPEPATKIISSLLL